MRAFSCCAMLLLCGMSMRAGQVLWGVDPFRNDYYQVNPADGTFLSTQITTLSGFTVTGLNAITTDPTSGAMYVIAKVNVGGGRRLGILDPTTGTITDLGSLGDNFASLTFDSSGQLYGVTGDGASVPETLYTIDKTNASKTLFQTLGNGSDGEVVAFNPNDGLIYHWSGSSIFESINLSTHAIVGIIQSGASTGEVFGAVWSPADGKFLVSNINSGLQTQTTDGLVASIGTATEDYRGLALQGASAVPEPATLGFMAAGLGALVWMRRRKG